MAADGSRDLKDIAPDKIAWSSDPTVLKMQAFAYGHMPKEAPLVVDRMFIRLPWFRETRTAIDRALKLSRGARKENSIRGQGPSRAGKTCVCRALLRERMPWRDSEGLHIPLGYMRVPAVPSVAVVGQEALRSLGDPTWAQRRSPTDRLGRLGEVAEMVGLQGLLVDDLHHLVDSRGVRVQHAVADAFIDIGDEICGPLVFLGLPRMDAVFKANEQLRGRAGAPIEYLRLNWRKESHRKLFSDAITTIVNQLRQVIAIDKSLDDETFCFRIYCGSGGLLGYVVLILRVAEFECRRKRVPLSAEIVRKAVGLIVGKPKSWPGGKDPFHPEFVAVPTKESLDIAKSVGKEAPPGTSKKNGSHKGE